MDRKTGWPLVYDWRAPISSMFYDYGLGDARYEGPGGVFEGTITLKRQYGIKDRKLVYMFDNDLNIDDEILREALGRNTSPRMRTIVNTIQREQNQAIRNVQDRRLLVEGAAGSGEDIGGAAPRGLSAIQAPRGYSARKHLGFSPNRIFSDYISQVLPDLGEENVPQLTYREFAESFFDWKWDVETQASYLKDVLRREAHERERLLASCSF